MALAGAWLAEARSYGPMHVIHLEDHEPFTTKDGSTIRELVGPAWTAARNQSLAEATVPPGGETD